MEEISKHKKQEINLKMLLLEYRDKGKALKGYERLIKLIREKKNADLDWLLRFHEHHPIVKQSEIQFRDNVDFLLKFYSLLEIAIMTDHIPPGLPDKLKTEIIEVLGNEFVKRYYDDYYKITLPAVLFKVVISEKIQMPVGTSKEFVALLLLDKTIDKDVENFLWLLDSGSFGDYSIASLRQTLRSRKQIEQIIAKPRKDETYADSAFWGFVKFSDYMQNYEALLRSCSDELLRSLLWHFQSYWFERMQDLMKDTYIPALRDIEELNNKVTFEQFKKNTIVKKTGASQPSIEKKKRAEYMAFKRMSKEETQKAIASVKYNLNQAHAVALLDYSKSCS